MKLKLPIPTLLMLALSLIAQNSFAQDVNFHIYLCFGQSNMEGSAEIEEIDKAVDPRFKVMQSMDCPGSDKKEGSWYPAVPPLSQCDVGLSPADYFGRTMVKHRPDSIRVGVINIAVGGCDIRLFDKDKYKDFDDTYTEPWFLNKVKGYGGNPYQRLIDLAKKAQKDGVIKGILLHQGETNTGNEEWPKYVQTVYNNILKDLSLKAKNVPLLAGEVVGSDQDGVCAAMNPIIAKLPETIPTSYIISSKGCGIRPDRVHFNSVGVRELGKRYAEKMLELEKAPH